jgi:hypothetical protein
MIKFPTKRHLQMHILRSDHGVKESDMMEVPHSSLHKLQKKMDIC